MPMPKYLDDLNENIPILIYLHKNFYPLIPREYIENVNTIIKNLKNISNPEKNYWAALVRNTMHM